MKIPERRFFVMNNMMVIPALMLKKNLTLEELGAYCVCCSTDFDWWKEIDAISDALNISRSKVELIRDALVEKGCLDKPQELPTDEEQAELASAIYQEIKEAPDEA